MFIVLVLCMLLHIQRSHAIGKTPAYTRDWTYQTEERNTSHQPIIKAFAWGTITIEDTQGKKYTFGRKKGERADIRLWPNGYTQWDWQKTGTNHYPGVQPDDFKDLVNSSIEYLILTQGVEGVLKTDSSKLSTYLETLKKDNPQLQVLTLLTPDAIQAYNKLVKEGKKVVGIFHTTC